MESTLETPTVTFVAAAKSAHASPTIKSRKGSIHESLRLEPPPLELTPDGAASTESPKLLPEPLLSDAEERLVLFPIKHADVWQRCKQQQAVI